MARNAQLFNSASFIAQGVYDAEKAYESVTGHKPPRHPEGSTAYKQFEWTPRRKRTLGTPEELASGD